MQIRVVTARPWEAAADLLVVPVVGDPDFAGELGELDRRTGGELRVSNYLLWQIAYAEIYVIDTFWPDFRRHHLMEAVLAYQKRERRYGGISARPASLGAP